jgi:hypothetical protein
MPRVQLDLSLAPRERWRCLRHMSPAVQDAYKGVHELLLLSLGEEATEKLVGRQSVKKIRKRLQSQCGKDIIEEIDGLADAMGTCPRFTLIVQIVYEIFAACTSAVVDPVGGGGPIHGRTLDWPLECLRNIACDGQVRCSDGAVFRAVLLPGFIGVLTGTVPGALSVSVNYRRSSWTKDICFQKLITIATSGMPVGLLVRQTLAKSRSFDAAVSSLSDQSISTPATYLTVAGTQAGEGVVITRSVLADDCMADGPSSSVVSTDVGSSVSQRWLGPTGVLVQTNLDVGDMDRRKDEASGESILRREVATQLLLAGQEHATVGSMSAVLNAFPVSNEATVHYTVMRPSDSSADGFLCKISTWFGHHAHRGGLFHCPAHGCNRAWFKRRFAKGSFKFLTQYYCPEHNPLKQGKLLEDYNFGANLEPLSFLTVIQSGAGCVHTEVNDEEACEGVADADNVATKRLFLLLERQRRLTRNKNGKRLQRKSVLASARELSHAKDY